MAGARRPVGVVLLIQAYKRVAVDGLNGLENRFCIRVSLLAGVYQPAHFDDIVQQPLQMFIQQGALQQIRRQLPRYTRLYAVTQ